MVDIIVIEYVFKSSRGKADDFQAHQVLRFFECFSEETEMYCCEYGHSPHLSSLLLSSPLPSPPSSPLFSSSLLYVLSLALFLL